MSDLTDGIVNGECCELCLVYFRKAHGHPVTCHTCWKDLTPKHQKVHTKAYHREIDE